MYEKEEKQLTEWKKHIDEQDVPDKNLDEAILSGVARAKSEQKSSRFNYKVILGLTALFLLLVGCVATIWLVNPELLADNEGLKDAMNHEYYQVIDEVRASNGLEVTIQGAIVDEKGFVLFYRVETDEKYQEVFMEDFEMTDKQGNDIEWSSASYGTPNYTEKGAKKFEGKMEMFTVDELSTFDFIASFKLRAQPMDGVENNGVRATFEIPFSLNKNEIAPKFEYVLNETVEIEGQKISFKKMTIYPLRAELVIEIDESNTKELLDFPDIKMVDGTGKERGKIMNGVTSTYLNEEMNKRIIYLQSNYFTDPKELYITLNEIKIQALDKDELEVVVDLDEEKIVKQPASGKFVDFEVKGRHLEFTLQHEEEFPFGAFAHVEDEDGNVLEVLSSGMYWIPDEKEQSGHYSVEIKGLSKMKGKLVLPLSFYPEWIEATDDVKIKVK